jgi:signal transduction histidine kinase
MIQHARLASLGPLAAGLAHELNNPASALRRGLPQLQDALTELDRCAGRVGELGLGVGPGQALRQSLLAASEPADPPLVGLDLLNAEDRLLDWLGARDVEHASRVAPPLAAAGWDPGRLEVLLAGIEPALATPVLHWLAARCAAAGLIDELTRSAAAISEVVSAVRSHSALGPSAVREHDVVQGIESALVILRGRLRQGVTVVRDFAPEVPRVEAFGAELNHVWSNLIENAIDAMPAGGTLELRTATSAAGISVEVTDHGPGIPEDVRPRIFDPFFTTKPPGVGTGLGLHIVHSTVRRHSGSVRVESRPGRTTFTVRLPLRLPAGA